MAHGFSVKDTGIHLVAKTRGTREFHAIRCKCHALNRVRKAAIDSVFTQRIIVSTTTNDCSKNIEDCPEDCARGIRIGFDQRFTIASEAKLNSLLDEFFGNE